jgi:hypothetical protein
MTIRRKPMTGRVWATRAGVATAAAVATLAAVATGPAVASSGPPTADAAYEAPGSASPEDAVAAYMNALAAADLDAMVGSFAVETFVDHFDLRAYLERVGVYSAVATPLQLPPDTPFTRALDLEQRQGAVVDQVRRQFVTLADPALDPTEFIALTDDAALDEFYTNFVAAVEAVDTQSARSFTFVALEDVDPASAARYESADNQANLDAHRAVLGADAITDLVVRFDVGGHGFLAFFSVVRYADGWWVEQLGGDFATLLGIDLVRAGTVPADETG